MNIELTITFCRDKLTLPQLLPRIIHERGQFTNITESSLEQELRGDSSLPDEDTNMEETDLNSESYPNTSTQTSTTTNEEFYKKKNEVLKHISIALNESSLALDFVSLLISCVRPAAGTISMSSHLKKFVPPGSLNADKVSVQITPEQREDMYKEQKNVGQGWKLSSLESSSTNLRSASARLCEEVQRERVFWDTIKKNFNEKEILYKTRDKTSGKRLFAVKYGYEDSGSTYRITGNAMLKPLQDDRIEFVPLSSRGGGVKRIVRVRILRKEENDDDYSIVGESRTDGGFANDDSIKTRIEKARFFIFEEELFSQLIDEATGLIAYNVKAESESKISIGLQDETIEIEHVEYEEDNVDNGDRAPKPEDDRAEMCVTFLRLMLTVKHKKNLESKKQLTVIKASSSSRNLMKPYSLILRPLVGHFIHEHMIQLLYSMVKNLLHNLDGAQFKLRRYINLNKEELKKDPMKRISEPAVSKFTLKVPQKLKIVLELNSFDLVNFRVNTTTFVSGKKVLESTFEDIRQIEECLEWLIADYSG